MGAKCNSDPAGLPNLARLRELDVQERERLITRVRGQRERECRAPRKHVGVLETERLLRLACAQVRDRRFAVPARKTRPCPCAQEADLRPGAEHGPKVRTLQQRRGLLRLASLA